MVLYRHTSLLGQHGDGTIPHRPPLGLSFPKCCKRLEGEGWGCCKDGEVASELSAFRTFTLSLSLPKKYKQPRRGRRRVFASIRSLHLSSGSPNPHHKPQFTQTATNPRGGGAVCKYG